MAKIINRPSGGCKGQGKSSKQKQAPFINTVAIGLIFAFLRKVVSDVGDIFYFSLQVSLCTIHLVGRQSQLLLLLALVTHSSLSLYIYISSSICTFCVLVLRFSFTLIKNGAIK